MTPSAQMTASSLRTKKSMPDMKTLHTTAPRLTSRASNGNIREGYATIASPVVVLLGASARYLAMAHTLPKPATASHPFRLFQRSPRRFLALLMERFERWTRRLSMSFASLVDLPAEADLGRGGKGCLRARALLPAAWTQGPMSLSRFNHQQLNIHYNKGWHWWLLNV